MKAIRLTTLAATVIASTLAVAAVAAAQEQTAANENDAKSAMNQSQRENDRNEHMKGKDATKPVVILVPVTFAAKPTLADGCWARLYDSENYGGGVLTLVGSVEIPSTSSTAVTGYEFGPNYDSVVVGPNAVMSVWDHENFQDKSARFQPGQRVPDLDEKMGFFDEIKSIKVNCRQ